MRKITLQFVSHPIKGKRDPLIHLMTVNSAAPVATVAPAWRHTLCSVLSCFLVFSQDPSRALVFLYTDWCLTRKCIEWADLCLLTTWQLSYYQFQGQHSGSNLGLSYEAGWVHKSLKADKLLKLRDLQHWESDLRVRWPHQFPTICDSTSSAGPQVSVPV